MKHIDPKMSQEIWSKLRLSPAGLIPAIVVEDGSNHVLMMAYMDEEAFLRTLSTALMHYHSRSRNQLWLKGETSGHFQHLVSCAVDCDADTLLFTVKQEGAACHTGETSCFYRELPDLLGS